MTTKADDTTAAGNDLPKYDPKADIEATWRRKNPTPTKAGADDILKDNWTQDPMGGTMSYKEAKQQLADGLIAALPKRLPDLHKGNIALGRMQGHNNAIDQAEAAIREYFK